VFLSKLKKIKQFSAIMLLVFFGVSFSVVANEHTIGDITVHYNAFNSSLISPEVATQYGIKRSGQTGILNISVLKNGQAVVANIFGHGKNLASQLKQLAFKEVKEDKAIYYIATFNFRSGERLSFDLQVQPEKTGVLMPLQFKQILYID